MWKKIENVVYWCTLVRPIYAIIKGAVAGIRAAVVAEMVNRKNYDELTHFLEDNDE